VSDEVDATEMTGVEHLGQYVFEMSQAKVEAVKRGEGVELVGTDTGGLSGAMSGDEDEAIQDVEEMIDEEGFEAEEDGMPLDNGETDKILEEYPQ
jgi:intron-binding protein aquarius